MHEGREQGADMGAETVYVRDFDGEKQERRAYTPTDVVNLEARGWVRKDTKSARTSGKGAPAAKAGASTEGNGPA